MLFMETTRDLNLVILGDKGLRTGMRIHGTLEISRNTGYQPIIFTLMEVESVTPQLSAPF